MDLPIDMYGDCHMHTLFSDGSADVAAMISGAAARGMAHIAITDHMPLPFRNRYAMDPDAIAAYQSEIRAARETCSDEIQVLVGIEMELLPGFEEWTGKILSAGWDYTIGSVHGMGRGGDFGIVNGTLNEFQRMLTETFAGEIRALVGQYYRQMTTLIRSGLFQTVGHLDVVKKHNADSRFFSEDADWYRDLVLETLDRAAESGMQVEINTAGFGHPVQAPYPSPWIIRACRDRGIALVMASDAHRPQDIGRYFDRITGIGPGKEIPAGPPGSDVRRDGT